MNYMKIEDCSLLNGDGARVVLWVSGCAHRCDECQNPETWNKNNGFKFDQTAFEQLLNLLSNSYIAGLTLSGGDPLLDDNYNEILNICKIVKQKFPKKDIWVWTGYTLDQLISDKKNEIFNYIDYLIDGRYEKNNTHTKKYRGSDNQKRYKIINGLFKLID